MEQAVDALITDGQASIKGFYTNHDLGWIKMLHIPISTKTMLILSTRIAKILLVVPNLHSIISEWVIT